MYNITVNLNNAEGLRNDKKLTKEQIILKKQYLCNGGYSNGGYGYYV